MTIAIRARAVMTMDARTQPPQGLAVVVIEGDRIVAVGPAAILDQHPAAEIIDVGERTVVPGFIDAHNHLSMMALHPLWADLAGAHDVAAIGEALGATPPPHEPDGFIRAIAWDDGKVPLTCNELDELEPDRPLVLAHFSYHQCVVNSRALDELHITASTPDPPGGRIEHFADGRPNGVLAERAWSEAHARSVEPYSDPERWADLIVERAKVLRTEGITAVHDPACSPAAEAVYAQLAAAGRLPISVLAMPHPAAMLGDPDPARLDGPPTGEGDEWLRVGPVKLFADGGNNLAVDGHIHDHPVSVGIRFESVVESIALASARGFGVAVHTMGNAMMDSVLDAFEAAARSGSHGHPFRIEHVTLAGPRHAARMAAMGIIGVVQPGFISLLGPAVVGFEIAEATWMPFGSLRESGLTMAGSSDDPCDADGWRVLRSSELGVTRNLPSGETFGPDQRVAREDWLRAYTSGSAAAGGQLAERGTITPGKRADLAVLDGRLDGDIQPRVIQTWVAGELVHEI